MLVGANIYIYIALIPKLFGQSLAEYAKQYAADHRHTPYGESIYDAYMNEVNSELSHLAHEQAAEHSTNWELMHDGFELFCADNPNNPNCIQTNALYDMCSWRTFDEDVITRPYPVWRLFDGQRRLVTTCGPEDHHDFNFLPLPEFVAPNPAPSIYFTFNLNPNDNGNPLNLGFQESYLANFHSAEVYDNLPAMEPDVIIPHIISSVPPSGNASIRVNNEHNGYHINKLERTFYVTDGMEFYRFTYALVMEDPAEHSIEQKPFFSAIMRDEAGDAIRSKCFIADSQDPMVDFVEVPGRPQPIVYRQWDCDFFDVKGYAGETLTVEFIAADCGLGAHFGYAYISDICEEECVPKIVLDPAQYNCLELYSRDFCGNVEIPSDYNFIDIFMDISREGVVIDQATFVSYDVTTGDFCFNVPNSAADGLPSHQGFDVFATLVLENPKGDRISIRSTSANPNTADDFDNDFYTISCFPLGKVGVPISAAAINVLSVYPNPSRDGELYLAGPNDIRTIYSIFDMTGKSLLSGQVNNGNPINIRSLNSGIYYIHIILESSEAKTLRFIVHN